MIVYDVNGNDFESQIAHPVPLFSMPLYKANALKFSDLEPLL